LAEKGEFLRGGDRPKNAEAEFPEVCVSPKGAYEPWMLFRKPIDTNTVAENLADGSVLES
jgi:site-specific DNA-methyltransferase (adenine-specific)